MLFTFFAAVRAAGVKASLSEFLSLLQALKAGFAAFSIDEFYVLARTALVKDETHYDRFDRAFAAYFKGVEAVTGELFTSVPPEWLQKQFERTLTEEERAKIQKLGGLDELMKTLEERLKEQKEQHHGGNKWIGTGGTSPFGNSGFNPEGVRMGGKGGGGGALKVWEKREFKNLDDSVELGTRNIKVALRRLRKFAREGSPDVLDMEGTIEGTAKNAGWLDLHMHPERRNTVKVLLFLDIGGSMDPHVRVCEELFSAAKGEFKHFEHYYFHNFIYESVWKDNLRRNTDRTPLHALIHKHTPDTRVVFVGDATMSPYEIGQAGGSVEHWNEESGATTFEKLQKQFPRMVWINPTHEEYWSHTSSINMVNELLGPGRMFPMTLKGLEGAMKRLNVR